MSEEIINVSHLKFSYDIAKNSTSVPLLCIPHFSLKRGERFFLHGESGSGKTTLLGLLTGVLSAQHGKLEVLGTDFTHSSPSTRDAIRGERMGYIFQLFNLIPYLTVSQNIGLPCRLHAKRNLRLKDIPLESEIIRLANALGIHELLDHPVAQLSVGQQQRVAAARALIGKPEIIIADEPTSALDHAHRGRFIDLLMKECLESNITLLFVSHDPTLAQHFDRQVSMSDLKKEPQP